MHFQRLLIFLVLAGYMVLSAPAFFQADSAEAGATRLETCAPSAKPAPVLPFEAEDTIPAGPDDDRDSSGPDNDEIFSFFTWHPPFLITALACSPHSFFLTEPSFPVTKPPQN